MKEATFWVHPHSPTAVSWSPPELQETALGAYLDRVVVLSLTFDFSLSHATIGCFLHVAGHARQVLVTPPPPAST